MWSRSVRFASAYRSNIRQRSRIVFPGGALDLEPVARGAGLVRAIDALRHSPLHAELAACVQQLGRRVRCLQRRVAVIAAMRPLALSIEPGRFYLRATIDQSATRDSWRHLAIRRSASALMIAGSLIPRRQVASTAFAKRRRPTSIPVDDASYSGATTSHAASKATRSTLSSSNSAQRHCAVA